MAKRKVIITEMLTRAVEVNADPDNQDAAIDIMRAKYSRGEIILCAEDYFCTDFEAQVVKDETV